MRAALAAQLALLAIAIVVAHQVLDFEARARLAEGASVTAPAAPSLSLSEFYGAGPGVAAREAFLADRPDAYLISAEADASASELSSEVEEEEAALAPGPPWTHEHVVDALTGKPVMVRRIIFCEVGRSGRYDPHARGRLGEWGPAQLLPGQGNGLAIFHRWAPALGIEDPDPENPYQAVLFVEEVIRRGMLGSQYPRTSLGCPGSP